MWHLVRAISGCHPALGQGTMQQSNKAGVFLPDVTAESFLQLFPKFKSLLSWPRITESLAEAQILKICVVTGYLQLCRR